MKKKKILKKVIQDYMNVAHESLVHSLLNKESCYIFSL